MIIDAHMHCWQLARGDYHWLTPAMGPLYRDYSPADISPIQAEQGIQGTVLVQAAPTVNETHYLLSLADQYACIKGVVGWVDFDHSEVEHQIEQLNKHPKLKGIRPMIQDIPDKDWMLSRAVNNSLILLEKHHLTFDALVKPEHLANLLTLLERHPDLKVVIDHSAKPDIQNNDIHQWKSDMKTLSESTHAMCKISGLLTEAQPDATLDTLKPYLDWLFECFGPTRLLFGSDWPVINLRSTYADWVNMLHAYTKHLSTKDKCMFWGSNTQRIYQIS